MIVEISGIDGSGKSSLASYLVGWFIRNGVRAYQRNFRSSSHRLLSYIEKREGVIKGTLYSREETELATAVEMVHTIHQNLCIEPVKFLDEVYIVEPYVYSWLSTAAAYDAKNIEGLALLYHNVPPQI